MDRKVVLGEMLWLCRLVAAAVVAAVIALIVRQIRLWLARRQRIKELQELYSEGEREALTHCARTGDVLYYDHGMDRALEDKRRVRIHCPGKARFLEKTTMEELRRLKNLGLFETATAGVAKYGLTKEEGKELGKQLLNLKLFQK